jgi:hypothetical protein
MSGFWVVAFVSALSISLHSVHAGETKPVESHPEGKPGPAVIRPEGIHSGLTEAERDKVQNQSPVSPEESEDVRPPKVLESSRIVPRETSKKPQTVEKAFGVSTILGDESSYQGPTEAERRKLIQVMRDDGIEDREKTQAPEPRNRRLEGESR